MSATVPTLTIGMPVFNGARFIRQALDSLLAQTMCDFELLISDNHSTDSTPRICEEYAQRDARIRYVRQDRNIGLLPNVTFVIQEARGRHFMLVGDDDVYEQAYAERLLAAMEQRSGVGLCYSDFAYIHEDGSDAAGGTNVFMDGSASRVKNLAVYLLKRPILPVIMGVFRTDVVRAALPFPSYGSTTWGADLVFVARALARTRVHSRREVLFRYRIKDRSSSSPSDWPATRIGRWWYLLRHNMRVTIDMCRAIAESDLNPAANVALVVCAAAGLAAQAVVPAAAALRLNRRSA